MTVVSHYRKPHYNEQTNDDMPNGLNLKWIIIYRHFMLMDSGGFFLFCLQKFKFLVFFLNIKLLVWESMIFVIIILMTRKKTWLNISGFSIDLCVCVWLNRVISHDMIYDNFLSMMIWLWTKNPSFFWLLDSSKSITQWLKKKFSITTDWLTFDYDDLYFYTFFLVWFLTIVTEPSFLYCCWWIEKKKKKLLVYKKGKAMYIISRLRL